jgi:F-type H+-transporting ATPase subunit b
VSVLTYLAEAGHVVAATATEHAAETPGGIAALGLNLQGFLFQLITFVIVFVILRQFVFKKLVKTLDDRREAVESSIKHAAETEEKLQKAQETIAGMLADGRKQADEVVAAAHKEANQMVEEAETKAAKRAEHIVSEAKSSMDVEVAKAREALKVETAALVAAATEQIIKQKLDPSKDAALIQDALKQAKGTTHG